MKGNSQRLAKRIIDLDNEKNLWERARERSRSRNGDAAGYQRLSTLSPNGRIQRAEQESKDRLSTLQSDVYTYDYSVSHLTRIGNDIKERAPQITEDSDAKRLTDKIISEITSFVEERNKRVKEIKSEIEEKKKRHKILAEIADKQQRDFNESVRSYRDKTNDRIEQNLDSLTNRIEKLIHLAKLGDVSSPFFDIYSLQSLLGRVKPERIREALRSGALVPYYPWKEAVDAVKQGPGEYKAVLMSSIVTQEEMEKLRVFRKLSISHDVNGSARAVIRGRVISDDKGTRLVVPMKSKGEQVYDISVDSEDRNVVYDTPVGKMGLSILHPEHILNYCISSEQKGNFQRTSRAVESLKELNAYLKRESSKK